MAALAFAKGFSAMEVSVASFVAIVLIILFGMLANGILGARGFGIAGNAILIAGGLVLAAVIYDLLVRQPDYVAFGLPERAVLVALGTIGATITLLGAAFIKRLYG